MLETGLFFLLSWSAFLSAEAAGLTGQCFVLSSPLDVWIPVFPAPHQVPLPDPAGVKWIVSESASPGYPGEKKKNASIIWQLNWKFPKCWFLFCPYWPGRGRWNLRMTYVLLDDGFTLRESPRRVWRDARRLCGNECWLSIHQAVSPGVRLATPNCVKNLCLHSVANQKTGR